MKHLGIAPFLVAKIILFSISICGYSCKPIKGHSRSHVKIGGLDNGPFPPNVKLRDYPMEMENAKLIHDLPTCSNAWSALNETEIVILGGFGSTGLDGLQPNDGINTLTIGNASKILNAISNDQFNKLPAPKKINDLTNGALTQLMKSFGVFGNTKPFSWVVKEKEGIFSYFDVHHLKIRSFGSPKTNAEILRSHISKRLNGGRVKNFILVGHSKGGLDILEFLLSDAKEVSTIKGVITMNTPYHGTPAADHYYKQISKFQKFVKLLPDNLLSIRSLSVEYRREFMRKYQRRITEILQKIPILNFSSYITGKEKEMYNKRELRSQEGAKFLRLVGIDPFFFSNTSSHDDLVPLGSQTLAGAMMWVIPGWNHMNATGLEFQPYLYWFILESYKERYFLYQNKKDTRKDSCGERQPIRDRCLLEIDYYCASSVIPI